MANDNLNRAKKVKNDEFYTQISDIEKELKHYKKHFNGQVVYLNCDSLKSNFWKFFKSNFEILGLKKLIATHYKKNDKTYKIEYEGEEIVKTDLIENGDFRSEECIKILKESDIIVTNPPFSLFREFIDIMIKYNKKFLVIGNMNAIQCLNMFKYIKENKIWLGNNYVKEFLQPDNTTKKFGNILWFTNLDYDKKHKIIENGIDYNKHKEEYLKYDNYDAINIDKINKIPDNYTGIMGVPITFLTKYNPNQFKILDITNGKGDFGIKPTKKYINPKQHNKNGTITNGSGVNSAGCIKTKDLDNVYYTSDNSVAIRKKYARILIRKINF